MEQNGNLILITGATGSLGLRLAEELCKTGAKIRCLVRSGEDVPDLLRDKNIEVVHGSLEDIDSLRRACAGADLIIHLAAITHTNDIKLYYRINAEGTNNLIKAAPKNIKKFIHISTCAIGKDGGAYSDSKRLAEEYLIQSGIPYIILRPSEVYGASKPGMIENLISLIKKSPVIPVLMGSIKLAPAHIDDVVKAIKQSIYLEKTRQIYNLAGPEIMTHHGIIDRICAGLGVKRIKLPMPVFIWRLTAFALACVSKRPFLYKDQISRLLLKKDYNIDDARHDLGFNPAPFSKLKTERLDSFTFYIVVLHFAFLVFN